MQVNLISDTVTQPTADMRAAMFAAPVGDDVFGEDPTINALEQKAATLFGHEAALFCASGVMCNQIAIKLHTQALDEVVCETSSHINKAEGAAYAWHSGVGLALIDGEHGKIRAAQLAAVQKPNYDWLPKTSLLVVENTANLAGGSYYNLAELKELHTEAQRLGWKVHLDGARIFNALTESGDSPSEIGPLFDSISVCLSKGLGAPVGSMLISSRAHIAQGRRLRKALGGGMRQAGFLAAAGIYALDHHVGRLKTDHFHANLLANALRQHPWVAAVRPSPTNIIIFDTVIPANDFLQALNQRGIRAAVFGPNTLRFVTHLDVSEAQIAYVLAVLSEIN